MRAQGLGARGRRGRAVVAALLLALTALAAGPVWAASEQETHCVVEVLGQRAGGELVTSAARCYATPAQAELDASAGTLAGEGFVVAATVTLGVHYEGRNGTGSSITVVGSGCSGGYWNTGSAWANRISSSKHGCYRLRHYDYPNKGGSYADTTGAGVIRNLPTAMDNRTESVSYHGS